MKPLSRLFPALGVMALCFGAFAQEKPSIGFVKAIGDVRGLGLDNLSVAERPDGRVLLLSSDGRLSEFSADGRYLRGFKAQVSWPYDKVKVDVVDGMVLVGDSAKDYPWVYDGRRAGSSPGRFLKPSDVVEDEAGALYVADSGNSRVQVFQAGDTAAPSAVIDFKAAPQRLAASKGRLAVSLADGTLELLRKEGGSFQSVCKARSAPLKALRFSSNAGLFAASNDELKLYSIEDDGLSLSLKLRSTLAPSWKSRWPKLFLNAVPFCKAPDGSVRFASPNEGALLSLNPETDEISAFDGLPKSARAVAFSKDGTLLAGCDAVKEAGKELLAFKPASGSLQALGSFSGKPLYAERDVPVWGLLPDSDGGVYVRVVKPGHQKGWPSLDVEKLFPDGRSKSLVSYKSVYSVRSVFGPWEGYLSMKFAKDGDVVLASSQLASVQKISPDGKRLWEAGLLPSGGASLLHLKRPRDMDIDSKGRVWVLDSDADKLLCLSPEGVLLLEYGKSGGVDELDGSMDGASGLAVVKTSGGEFLYLGDAGNRRILKYRIE